MDILYGRELASLRGVLQRYEMELVPQTPRVISPISQKRLLARFDQPNVLVATQLLLDYLHAPLVLDGFEDHMSRRVAQTHIINKHGKKMTQLFEQNPISWGAISHAVNAHHWLSASAQQTNHTYLQSHLAEATEHLRTAVMKNSDAAVGRYHKMPNHEKLEIVSLVSNTSHGTLEMLAAL